MKTEARFQHDFILDGKAVEVDDHLIVEGYAADFGFDRQDEAFEPGAFDEGMKAFMETNPIVVYHHKFDQPLGKVLEWEGKAQGPWVKVRVDRPEPSSQLADIYTKIKNGIVKGFSVGGKFYRREGSDGRPRIHKADIAELSITPLPINPRTLFEVAGKAFGEDDALDEVEAALERISQVFDTVEKAIG